MTSPDAELARYARQLALPGWSVEAQRRLADSSAIVVGAGALGCPAATYLTAAGIGRIGIVDHAEVTLADVGSEALHYTPDIGANKAESAAAKLGVLNSQVQAEPYPVRLEAMNARPIIAGADVVIDCVGGGETSYLLNDAGCAERVPLAAAWTSGLSALLTSVLPGRSACLRCAALGSGAEPPASPDAERGALGALAGIVGSTQALEALKLLTGIGPPLVDRLLRIDGRDLSQTSAPTSRQAGCPACADFATPQQSA